MLWQCFVFQELHEQVFPEIINVKPSNIISTDSVDCKPEKNEALFAAAKEENFRGGMKFL